MKNGGGWMEWWKKDVMVEDKWNGEMGGMVEEEWDDGK